MDALKFLKVYAAATVVFFAIDMLWLGVIAGGFYKKQLGHLMLDKVNWPPALVFYLFYIAGVLILVVNPAAEKGSLSLAVMTGALFGAVAYSTYDLSNYATLKDWPFIVVAVDIVWGACLTAIISAAGWYFSRIF